MQFALIIRMSLLLLVAPLLSVAQQIESIYAGLDTDSSYYDIYQVAENDVWIGGEYGVIKRLRSDGTLEAIDIPNNGANILKFLQLGNYIYISADRGTIYKYNLKTSTCTRTEFKGFERRCFYDLAYDNNGNLVVCGGSSGIGKGKKRIPNGFIATIDTSLTEEPVIVWKNALKFVWSLAAHPDGGMAAAVFNGYRSQIYHADLEQLEWNARTKVRGLIHALQVIDGKLAYSGCRSIQYHKTGIWGFEQDAASYTQIKGAGIICNLLQMSNGIYGFSSQGLVYQLDSNESCPVYQTGDGFALYEALPQSDDCILLVGHGKSALKLQLSQD
jgi:WD40 repeat protein